MDLKSKFLDLQKLTIREIRRKYKFLGEGIARKVYAIDENFVIKIAKNRSGLFQNAVERYVYTHASSEQKKYLCPILIYTPRIIAMKRALPLSALIKDEFIDLHDIRKESSAFDDLRQLAKDYYLFYEDINATSSWGILNGENVLIDYGCTSKRGDFVYTNKFFREKPSI